MYQYSFANTDLILKIPDLQGNETTLPITGFGTGENLFSISRRAPIADVKFSAYGDMVVSMQRIRAGDLAFTVLMNAPENAVLQKYCEDFQSLAYAGGQLVHPISGTMVDNMGKDEATLLNGVILAIPAMSRGQTMNTITWVLTFESVVISREVGGDHTLLGTQTVSGSNNIT